MKSKLSLIILLAFISVAAHAFGELSFTIGSIGGSICRSKDSFTGFLEGTLLDVHLDFDAGIGAEMNALKYYVNDTDDGFSLINAALYYRAVRFYKKSWFGPFARFNWLDFSEKRISYSAGLRLNMSGPFATDFYGTSVRFSPPLIFKYVDFELGYMHRETHPIIFTHP
ncbi:MAG: hypothetical protein ACTTKL_05550 [Treponema sp.]